MGNTKSTKNNLFNQTLTSNRIKVNEIKTYSLIEVDSYLQTATYDYKLNERLIKEAGFNYVCFSNRYGHNLEIGKYRHIFTDYRNLTIEQIYKKLHEVGVYLKLQIEPSIQKFIDRPII